MLVKLRRILDAHQSRGRVSMDYVTEIYLGR